VSKKKKTKEQSALQGAMLNPSGPVLRGLAPPAEKSGWPAVITVPVALVVGAALVFGIVRLVKWAWFLSL